MGWDGGGGGKGEQPNKETAIQGAEILRLLGPRGEMSESVLIERKGGV